jgi:hypothetical protein
MSLSLRTRTLMPSLIFERRTSRPVSECEFLPSEGNHMVIGGTLSLSSRLGPLT